LPTFLPLHIEYDTDRTENTPSNSYTVECVFIFAVMYLPKLLPGNDKGTQTHSQQGDVISLFLQNKESMLKIAHVQRDPRHSDFGSHRVLKVGSSDHQMMIC
jgi:hypothetical protein